MLQVQAAQSQMHNVVHHQNGHLPNGHPPHAPPALPRPANGVQKGPAPAAPIHVVGIPSVRINEQNRLVVGSAQTRSPRAYTPLKLLGDGSFGTVWLCDWHGTLPPNTPLSPMQCGDGARPDWVGKRLVAVKHMKKKWEGGWDECQRLKELESLRAIPFHPNIIPLYDFFLLPDTNELYFVFESMEGNLYHLIKARKGRALAGGLVSLIFRQIVSGLEHIHSSGYFHRDMKPENVLVTTTGLFDYTPLSPTAPPNAPKEKDVVCIIKLADFGLARETKSKSPYTEYVSTRWYRAPEVLLLSRDYSNPVDMWALGTIMAELVNLKPLFPGQTQVDQVTRIGEVLGDPSDNYGHDCHSGSLGGGAWPRGVKLARSVGYEFPEKQPKDIHSFFDPSVPDSLIHCIRDLLRYDPDRRLTSRQCLEHQYLRETTPMNIVPLPKGVVMASNGMPVPRQNGSTPLSSLSPRPIPPSHSHNSAPRIPDVSNSHRTSFYPPSDSSSISTNAADYVKDLHVYNPDGPRNSVAWQSSNGDHNVPSEDAMDLSPRAHPNGQVNGNGLSVPQDSVASDTSQPQGNKLFGSLKRPKWGGIFGGDKSQALPRVDEGVSMAAGPLPKRPQSSSSDVMPGSSGEPEELRNIKKLNKKEAERIQKDAEKQRRLIALQNQREQARAVMQKRNQIMQKTTADMDWLRSGTNDLGYSESRNKGKRAASSSLGVSPGKQNQVPRLTANNSTLPNASSQHVPEAVKEENEEEYWRGDSERAIKARRLEWDEESSSDVHSVGRMSTISFATVDSDPGPSAIRNRPGLFGIPRMQSTSSLRTSIDDFSPSARSSNSFSIEGQYANDYRAQSALDTRASPLAGSVSPPPMQTLTLSPSLPPSVPPSASPPPWVPSHQLHSERFMARREAAPAPPYATVDPAYEFHPQLHTQNTNFVKQAINPIFKVPPYPLNDEEMASPTSLPPFSELDAVAASEYSPVSPLSFATHSEDPSSPM